MPAPGKYEPRVVWRGYEGAGETAIDLSGATPLSEFRIVVARYRGLGTVVRLYIVKLCVIDIVLGSNYPAHGLVRETLLIHWKATDNPGEKEKKVYLEVWRGTMAR